MKKNKLIEKFELLFCILFAGLCFTGCYSVFSGGTGGLVVDAESTSSPKAGIANVDVYAYLDSGNRDGDYNRWKEDTVFVPSGYYGHTATANDGSFTISKLVWKEQNPDFGKDADYTDVYLLFYHEKYGLTKGQTIIISDSSTDTVYAELTPIKKSATLNLRFVDVASGNNTDNVIYVKVSVPQATEMNTAALPKVYEGTFAGAGSLTINYPRWTSKENRTNGIENAPELTITYSQSADEITWKGCYNADNEAKNYAFRADAETGIKRIVRNPSYTMTFYGKSTRLSVPSVNGQYVNAGTSADDGVLITMMKKDSAGAYSIDLGHVTTSSQALGTSGTEKHGTFSGLGNGYTWTDTEYTDKFSKIDVEIKAGAVAKQVQLRSDDSNYTVQLQ